MSGVGSFYVSTVVFTAQCECGAFGDWHLDPRHDGGRPEAIRQARNDGWKVIGGKWKCPHCSGYEMKPDGKS